MEKMFQEVYSLRRELNDLQNANKDLIKQTNLDKLEEKIGDKMNELKITLSKKYLEKVEHYKAIKNLESQIKVQVDDNKKDADSWLMAKRPLKCFNCATCESNIKNITPTNEYLAWNKYPPSNSIDKIFRINAGFSKVLQMANQDNRNEVNVLDFRLAIQTSKNIYPDVIAKSLPEFDKVFADQIIEHDYETANETVERLGE